MKRRAFTLVELMVAVVVLLAVIVATSKIFATASKVTSMGEASADVLQQAGVIEEQIRRDIESISQDGYIALSCVAVRNDVNSFINGTAAPLLNPQLAADAIIRADQIVFFKCDTETTMRWTGPNDTAAFGGNQQSRATRVYYGHGVQLPDLGNDPGGAGTQARPVIQGVTPVPAVGTPQQIVPWTWWDPGATNPKQVKWRWGGTSQTSAGMPRISPNQPGAREWVLCRKAVLLADDLGSPLFYPDPMAGVATSGNQASPTASVAAYGDKSQTAPTDAFWMYMENRGRDYVPVSNDLIPSPMMQSGWVDAVSSELSTIHRTITPSLAFAINGATGQTSVVFPPAGGPSAYSIYSVVPPWIAQGSAGTGVGSFPPVGWPIGTSAAPWPSGTQVGTPSNATTPPLGTGYSSQRDRIVRATFGPIHNNASGLNSLGGAGFANVGLIGWPRAEKQVPNLDRRSEILVTPVLSNNCSSFQIDWTWERGTGRQSDATGAPMSAIDHLGSTLPGATVMMRGFEPDAGAYNAGAGDFVRIPRPQPWFGFPDTGNGMVVPPAWQRMGVTLAQDATSMPTFQQGTSINITNQHMRGVAQGIEGIPGDTFAPTISAPYGAGVPIRIYTAVFGFNQGTAYTVTPDGIRVLRDDFTPWPTQLRFTLTLHDPRLVLDRGRDFQFVVDLPKRRK